MTSESLAELQAVLDKHRSNEAMYKEKVKEINLTRGKIADQLEILQQNYDKKVKGLEQKLEQLKTQNDGLIRENALCKSEIETYQSRLLEKEKIIAMLLNQRKDQPLAGSEKSKSDKTDSLNANQEDSKAFKKQGAVFREDYEHVEKIREESSGEKEKSIPEARVERQPERQVEKQVEKQAQRPVQKQVEKQAEVRKPVPPPKRVIPAQPVQQPKPVHTPPKAVEVIQPIVQQQQNQPESQPEPATVQSRPPPPKQKSKPPKKNPPPVFQVRRYETNQHEAQEPQFQASDFFKNLGNPSRQQPTQPQPQIHSYEEANPLQTQEYVYEQQLVQNEPHQHFHQENHFQQEQQQPAAVQQQHQQQPQEQPQPVQPQNNFLSNNYSGNFYEPYQPTKKANKRKPRADIPHHNQPQVSGSDFFNQLSKAEHQPHHSLDIEQSSIDHIDRDNSLLSNQQPYFADHDAQQVSKPKKAAVKMPKKKMKRDKIKMMDPSCFQ